MVYVRLELFSDKGNYVLHVFLLYMPLAYEFSNQLSLLLYIYLIYCLGLGEEEGFARRLQGGPLELVFFHTTSCSKAIDQEAQRSIVDYILLLVNRKIYGTVAPRRAVAIRLGEGREGYYTTL